jgi:hypothetical protein
LVVSSASHGAKAGSVDLEKADEERVMLQLLKVLREAGA